MLSERTNKWKRQDQSDPDQGIEKKKRELYKFRSCKNEMDNDDLAKSDV